MANVTTNILRSALQRVKSELDLKADSSSLNTINTTLASKANTADIVTMSAAEGNNLFDEVFGSYQFSTPSTGSD